MIAAQPLAAKLARKCEECPTIFTPGNSRGRYCSHACGQRAWRRAHPGYQSAATKRSLEASPARQVHRRTYMEEYRQRPDVIARTNALRRQRYAEDPSQQIAASRERNRSRRQFLQFVKTTCGCIDCGTRLGVLHFDHRPGTEKLFNIASAVQRTLATVIAEIEKCDVRCASCHATRHNLERRKSQSA